MSWGDGTDLVEELLAGDHRALARVISLIENRQPGYRELVSRLHTHTGNAQIVGVTGSPGAGKSTLVDKLAKRYRDRGETVGVIAVDPSSPYTGGAVLGDRIRMASTVGDMDVFFRSMSARGQLGGLSMATSDAITALDAFGKDRIVIETVGAGQNEVDIVETADTVAVLVQPGSGDDVQMLKAGILEIGDVFVVNKADMDGADRTVAELEEMLHMRESPTAGLNTGHHGVGSIGGGPSHTEPTGVGVDEVAQTPTDSNDGGSDGWKVTVVETVATDGTGVGELLDRLDSHYRHLQESDRLAERTKDRYAKGITTLLRNDVGRLVEREIDRQGGLDRFAERVARRETDPYEIAAEIVDPIEDCLDDARTTGDDSRRD